ncbi:putative 2-succinyl-6-hydroxy-2,4-cyclohexadiene-1-carboxylate synthase [Jeotgalicoccus coquinae]|uniref:2-succinyl-6-hydroxy-2,4-cyclohexadiene-1-carboxylate synthase n=1 Tax=Jeotgalicoccus coquinae TaxID=709509 RepID=A0A6V7RTZ7_9STAP|nr:2-succinyl-6-hydroxy-2,4-cyclohexadiene-1-carboxylate synthase [Jeotgalicoccus coquinae]MBB6423253.1 2-succinyl-6-hydroxy-2,4-cyclohexadiene-1-carboxylate synthase [Jeotgalicoccus coquinae]GGE09467.1 putative 2-succinyl-6-hydroxy-2,4-cyclohexadiene-1-carboxylate synthase [Jeotgalicoccus coquinae]CAD2081879.1 2-succinyl-6-hydroxy-2, 4-cyclohexadiene-1-carboxylate synthase [Jeotgalicoccus coquinae]
MLNFNYELIDNNKDSTIMLLHGFLSSKESMRDIAAGLSGLRNVILVDLPGFGGTKSSLYDYGMADIAAGLIKIAERHGISTFDVLGYSMGGRTALALTSHFPERIEKCILESASPGIPDTLKRAERLLVDTERSEFITADYKKFLEFWQEMPLFQTQQHVEKEKLDAQAKERLQQIPAEAADSLLKYGTGVQQSYWKDLSSLNNDFYLITGSEDTKFIAIAESMSERLKSAKLDIVDNCGHNIHLENFEVYINTVRKYLEEDNS